MVSKAAKRRAAKREERHSASHRAWCKRHPEKAREERALRQAQAALQRDFGHKVNGTPETHRHAAAVRQGALARLYAAGSISIDELAWALEIRVTHERITGGVAIGTMSLETRVDQNRSGDGTFFERLGAVRAEVAYGRWRADLPAAAPVLAMIVDDQACSVVGRRFRRSTRTLRKWLTEALDAWPDYYSEACDEVDEPTLLAAHAAIL